MGAVPSGANSPTAALIGSAPPPAMVVMMPSASTDRRTAWPVSAMSRLPWPSTARPTGTLSGAAIAGPPSPVGGCPATSLGAGSGDVAHAAVGAAAQHPERRGLVEVHVAGAVEGDRAELAAEALGGGVDDELGGPVGADPLHPGVHRDVGVTVRTDSHSAEGELAGSGGVDLRDRAVAHEEHHRRGADREHVTVGQRPRSAAGCRG